MLAEHLIIIFNSDMTWYLMQLIGQNIGYPVFAMNLQAGQNIRQIKYAEIILDRITGSTDLQRIVWIMILRPALYPSMISIIYFALANTHPTKESVNYLF